MRELSVLCPCHANGNQFHEVVSKDCSYDAQQHYGWLEISHARAVAHSQVDRSNQAPLKLSYLFAPVK